MKRACVLCGLVAALLCLTAAVASSRQPALSNNPGPPDGLSPLPAAGAAAAAPKPEGIDDLLTRLNAIRAQMAALEKAEQETVSRIKDLFQRQKQQLRDHGVIRDDAGPPEKTTLPQPQSGPTWAQVLKGE